MTARALPGWPLLMPDRMAADYVTLPVPRFIAEMAKAGIAPVMTEAGERWNRHSIDEHYAQANPTPSWRSEAKVYVKG